MNQQHIQPASDFVSVVIPVYNEERYLDACLSALYESLKDHAESEVIIVDNGSTDRSIEIARQYTDQVFIHTDCNVGAVRNYGVTQAKGNILTFIDSDCTVERSWISNGVALIRSSDKLIAGGSLRVRANAGWVERLWLLQADDSQFKQTDLLGSCTFVRKEHFDLLDGFNEVVSSGEDSNFSLRARKAGFQVEINENINVVHLGNPTTLGDFIKRQAWHAENYISQIMASLKDIVFWLVVLYLSGLIIISTAVLTPLNFHFWYLVSLAMPALVLSVKRMARSKYKPDSLLDLAKVFILDNCYLLGRSFGVVRGLVRVAFRR